MIFRFLGPVVLTLILAAGCGKKESTQVVMPTVSTAPKPKPVEQPADGSAPPAPDAAMTAPIPTSTEPFDLAKLNETLKLFCRDQTRYPKDLTELVGPGFLTAVPQVPPGKKLILDKEKVEFKLVDK